MLFEVYFAMVVPIINIMILKDKIESKFKI